MGSGHGVISVSSHTTPEQPHRVGTVPHNYLLSELVGKMKEFPSEEPKKVTLRLMEVKSQPFKVIGLSRTWATSLIPTEPCLSHIQQP